MEPNRKTVIVTGASQGIGAGIVQAFLARGYNVVGTARSATKSKELSASDHLGSRSQTVADRRDEASRQLRLLDRLQRRS